MLYKIVIEQDALGLERKVNELISEGWSIVGGVTVLTESPRQLDRLAQVMVKDSMIDQAREIVSDYMKHKAEQTDGTEVRN